MNEHTMFNNVMEVLLNKIALSYVWIHPPSILKHPSVAVTNMLGSHYGHLTTKCHFSFPFLHAHRI